MKTLWGERVFGLLDELLNRDRQKHKDGETVRKSGAEGRRGLGEKKVPFSLISGGKLISSRM